MIKAIVWLAAIVLQGLEQPFRRRAAPGKMMTPISIVTSIWSLRF